MQIANTAERPTIAEAQTLATASSLAPGSALMRRTRVLVGVVAATVLLTGASAAPASAACKRGLNNQVNEVFGWAKTVTEWCYFGGHVTSRHSQKHWKGSLGGFIAGYRLVTTRWATSRCHDYNGIWNHNCLTRAEIHAWKIDGSQDFWCIHTRIYGNGAHKRAVTPGNCP